MGKGSRVLVLYEETNPANARLSTQISNKTLALILLAIAIVVMALTYVSTYFVFKSKQYATIAGGLDLASQVTGMLRN
jgi:flagellar basal body-associated protein FliL